MTLGHEVVDTFYVTEGTSGRRVEDPERMEALHRTIVEQISSRP